MERNDAGGDAHGRQFLTFALGAEEYGIDILRVQEIRGYTAITPIPGAPSYVRGVMNLRGAVVPVIGLRERFAMAAAECDKFTVIVVVSLGAKSVGVVVDAVSDVLTPAAGEIEPPPEIAARKVGTNVVGLAKSGERLVILLDLDRLLSDGADAFDFAA